MTAYRLHLTKPVAGRQQQRGAVLIVAMVFLLLITIVAVVGSRRSTLELQMAGNDQLRAEYAEYANALIDEIKHKDTNIKFKGQGFVNCNAGNPDADCDEFSLTANKTYMKSVLDSGEAEANYKVENVGVVPASILVQSEGTASDTGGESGDTRGFYLNTVHVDIDGQTSKSSAAEVEYGFMKFCNACGGGETTLSGQGGTLIQDI